MVFNQFKGFGAEREIVTEVMIDAPPDRVWLVLAEGSWEPQKGKQGERLKHRGFERE